MSLLDKVRHLFSDGGMPPADFFSGIKKKSQPITTDTLKSLRESLKEEILQFLETGQTASAERLLFHVNTIGKELDALEAGFHSFVYRDDIEEYITNVSKTVVKITEIGNFERKIPNDKAQIISKARPIFDDLLVVFTDYTGREERKIAKKDRAKDPIVFGVFHSKDNRIWNHRFYVICDWVDDYCDLTLDKFITEMATAHHDNVYHTSVNITIRELERRIKEARENPEISRPLTDGILKLKE